MHIDFVRRGRRVAAYAALPWFRLELPGWPRLSSLVGLPIGNEDLWAGRTELVRGKLHGYSMCLDMEDWSERLTYFLGRYYELPVQLFVQAALGPGELFVDVGANTGMVSLVAARAMREKGRIQVFEPNPRSAERLVRNFEQNGLSHLATVHVVALSDATGSEELTILPGSSGWSSLARDPNRADGTVRVPLARGDDFFSTPLQVPVTMKIDVEGLEMRVIRGFHRFLERERPAVITEIEHRLLRRAETSAGELAAFMQQFGYRSYRVDVSRRGRTLKLQPEIDLHAVDHVNVAWLHPGGLHQERLTPFVTAA